MKEIKRYLNALLPLIALISLVIGLAYYAIGVIERNNALNLANERFDRMEVEIKEKTEEQELVFHELRDHYLTRARVAAMMISSTPDILTTETGLEELRIALDCSTLSVSDENGAIRYSTAHTSTGQRINDALSDGLTNRGFSDVVLLQDENSYTILAGTTRLDAQGVIQLTFSPSELEQYLGADISEVVLNQRFLESGTLAVLDEELCYLSHTMPELIGLSAFLSKEQLSEPEDQFTISSGGEKYRIMYRKYEDKILLCTLSSSALYKQRGTAIPWLLLLGGVILIYNVLHIHSVQSIAAKDGEK